MSALGGGGSQVLLFSLFCLWLYQLDEDMANVCIKCQDNTKCRGVGSNLDDSIKNHKYLSWGLKAASGI